MKMKRIVQSLTLVERECYRFGSMLPQTIGAPVLSTVLFILIFGYSLGSRIDSISGVRYILYILPGLIAMSVMTNSYSNSSSSLFMSRIDHSIENILATPVTPLEIVLSFTVGGILRGVLVGVVALIAACLLTSLTVQNLLLTFFYLVALSTLFSSLGILAGLWADNWDQLGFFSSFVLTPLVYLGGVFYSVRMLPPFWQRLSLGNPILYFVEGFRYSILGVSDIAVSISIGVIVILAVLSVGMGVLLFRVGYKLIT